MLKRSLSPSQKRLNENQLTTREMGYAEIEEKFYHFKKTSE
jgi:hypothetical protein